MDPETNQDPLSYVPIELLEYYKLFYYALPFGVS